MHRRNPQSPSAVIMIRPHCFTPNPETAQDNAFQQSAAGQSDDDLAKRAYQEASNVASVLEEHGIAVHVYEDQAKETPDSVFPNNWFSTHSGGHIAIYPMYASSRRKERRHDIIEMLKKQYRVQDVVDYSGLELDGLFLEGTGAMVLDHIERVAYTIASNRADPVLLERFCTHFNYEPMVFHASDVDGIPVYHTNVLMCIATEFALVGLDMVSDTDRRGEIKDRLEASGRMVINLSAKQVEEFAGNAMELNGKDGYVLALSQRANDALTEQQKSIIERSAMLLPLNVSTIEMAGGSVRCMLAGIHLTER